MQHRRLRNHAPPQAPRRAAPRGLPRGFRILSRISALSGPRYVTAERLHIYAPKTRVRTAHTPPHRRHASRAGSAGTRAARNSSNEHPSSEIARQHDPAKRPRRRRTRAASSPASRSRAHVAPSARSRAAFPACTAVSFPPAAISVSSYDVNLSSVGSSSFVVTLVLVPVRAPAGRLAFRLACSFVSHFRPWGT